MPRIRTLKPEHRQHRKVGRLSDREYRLWVGMILEADDEGRLVADADSLRVSVFGYQASVKAKHVEAALQTIAQAGLVGLYESAGARYACFPSWGDHQRIHRHHFTRSKLPDPPDQYRTCTVPVPQDGGSGTAGSDRIGSIGSEGKGSEDPRASHAQSNGLGDSNGHVPPISRHVDPWKGRQPAGGAA